MLFGNTILILILQTGKNAFIMELSDGFNLNHIAVHNVHMT